MDLRYCQLVEESLNNACKEVVVLVQACQYAEQVLVREQTLLKALIQEV